MKLLLVCSLSILLLSVLFSCPSRWRPWALLFSGDREEALQAWREYAPINEQVLHPSRPIPEVLATDFTMENMVAATDGFRRPAVVRGLYVNSTAVKQWHTREYLPNAFGDVNIPVVKDGSVGTLQDERVVERFSTSYRRVFDSDYSKEYLFFPAKSRFTFDGVDDSDAAKLNDRCNEIVRSDLDLSRIRPGMGGPDDARFKGSQFVIGKSPSDSSVLVTGSDFHCAGGNNWFIQVAGKKRWEFIMPEFSSQMWPLKGGIFNFWTGNKDMARAVHHIPSEFVDLEPGDVLFNPPWQWHKITSLSIGVPVREKNGFNTIANNPYFCFIMVTNLLLESVGLGLHGYPPPSASTEHDN